MLNLTQSVCGDFPTNICSPESESLFLITIDNRMCRCSLEFFVSVRDTGPFVVDSSSYKTILLGQLRFEELSETTDALFNEGRLLIREVEPNEISLRPIRKE